MGWESSGVVRFDLVALLQSQMGPMGIFWGVDLVTVRFPV